MQCSQSDLICLALVCRKFHELAASQLYRNFHIVFPDEDDPTFDSPIDGLASGLDTFITSEYNYAIHLRDLSLDTLSAGGRAEQAYRPYLYKVSCGKFMNTMLLLTLRKAKALESFKWNIRVELSRRVYKALHDIKSLKHFHVRMQSGHSSYETPPPLPWNADYSVNSDTASHADNVWSTAGAPSVLYGAGTNAPLSLNGVSPATGPFGINIPQQYTTYAPPPFIPLPTINPHVMPPPIPTLKPPFRNKVPRKHDGVKEPLTIAGLHKLQTICILDIDNLDIVPEIQTCIQQSSSQLRKLKLSFSDYLASQARKPKVELDPNESDDDDEFQVVPMTTSYDDGNGPVKAFRAQEERKAQESVLGRIFQVEPFIARTLGLARKHRRREKTKEPGEQASGSRQVLFLSAIREASKRLTESIPNLASDASKQQEILDLITAASRLYVDDVEKDALRTSQGVYIPPSWFSEGITKPRTTSASEDDKQHPESYAEDKAVDPTPRTNLHRERDNDIEPEDIDVAKPEDQFIDDSLDEGSDDTTSRNDPVPDSTPPTAIATNPSHGTPSQVNSVAPGVIAVEVSPAVYYRVKVDAHAYPRTPTSAWMITNRLWTLPSRVVTSQSQPTWGHLCMKVFSTRFI